MIKVRLVFETEIPEEDWDGTQYDLLRMATSNWIVRGTKCESTDDWADLFTEMSVNGSTSYPGFGSPLE